jgi:hypothetical protein
MAEAKARPEAQSDGESGRPPPPKEVLTPMERLADIGRRVLSVPKSELPAPQKTVKVKKKK